MKKCQPTRTIPRPFKEPKKGRMILVLQCRLPLQCRRLLLLRRQKRRLEEIPPHCLQLPSRLLANIQVPFFFILTKNIPLLEERKNDAIKSMTKLWTILNSTPFPGLQEGSLGNSGVAEHLSALAGAPLTPTTPLYQGNFYDNLTFFLKIRVPDQLTPQLSWILPRSA